MRGRTSSGAGAIALALFVTAGCPGKRQSTDGGRTIELAWGDTLVEPVDCRELQCRWTLEANGRTASFLAEAPRFEKLSSSAQHLPGMIVLLSNQAGAAPKTEVAVFLDRLRSAGVVPAEIEGLVWLGRAEDVVAIQPALTVGQRASVMMGSKHGIYVLVIHPANP